MKKNVFILIILLMSSLAYAGALYVPQDITDLGKVGTLTDSKWCSYSTANGLACTQTAPDLTTKVSVTSAGGSGFYGRTGGTEGWFSSWDQDFSANILSVPSGTSLPATCSVNQIFNLTTATAGQRLYLCESANSWHVEGDGGGSGSGTIVSGTQYHIPMYSTTSTTLGDSGIVTDANGYTITTVKQSGTADYVLLRQAHLTDAYGVAWLGPASRTTSTSLYLQLPDADPNGQVLSCGAPSSGVSICSWSSTGSGMTYPGAGIPVSTGSAWGTSLSETDGNIIYGSSGSWTKGTALPNGITATTQSSSDNSTKVATTAYADQYNPVVTSSNGGTITAINSYNITTGATTWTLPATATGKQACFRQADAATNAISVTPPTSSYVEAADGSAYCTVSHAIKSGGANGDSICYVAIDSTHWMVFGGAKGTWTCQ